MSGGCISSCCLRGRNGLGLLLYYWKAGILFSVFSSCLARPACRTRDDVLSEICLDLQMQKSISSVLYHYRLTGENRYYFLYSLASTVWSCSLFEKVTKTFAGELENNDFSSHSSEFICMSTVLIQLRSSWERLSVQFFFFFPSRVSMAFKMIAFCSAPETWVVRLLYTSGTVSDKYWEYKQGSDEKAR